MTTKQAAEQLPLLLTVADLQGLWRCKRTTAYARTSQPGFPAPIAFSGASYRWWRHEVLEWMEAQRLTVRPTRQPSTRRAQQATDEPLPLPAPTPVARRKPLSAA